MNLCLPKAICYPYWKIDRSPCICCWAWLHTFILTRLIYGHNWQRNQSHLWCAVQQLVQTWNQNLFRWKDARGAVRSWALSLPLPSMQWALVPWYANELTDAFSACGVVALCLCATARLKDVFAMELYIYTKHIKRGRDRIVILSEVWI